MGWILGIDEAGYGPNLGPFVMTAVACRVPDDVGCLWQLLRTTVRRASDPRDDRLVIDDSKAVYGSGRSLAGLERGVRVVLSRFPTTLDDLIVQLCPDDHGELQREAWYTGTTLLPNVADQSDLDALHGRFRASCEECELSDWLVRSVLVCPERFNALIDHHDSKSGVVSTGFIELLKWGITATENDSLDVHVDKQGGRNTYAAQVQQALAQGIVVAVEETASRSRYRVAGLSRSLRVCFEPRADQSQFCVALASMVSKYLRELLMGEFNAFWRKHVPDLKPTAGYPADAARYFKAIRAAMTTLQIREEVVWRKR